MPEEKINSSNSPNQFVYSAIFLPTDYTHFQDKLHKPSLTKIALFFYCFHLRSHLLILSSFFSWLLFLCSRFHLASLLSYWNRRQRRFWPHIQLRILLPVTNRNTHDTTGSSFEHSSKYSYMHFRYVID